MSTTRPRQTENSLIKSAEDLAERHNRLCSKCGKNPRAFPLSWCTPCRNAKKRERRAQAKGAT